MKVEQYIALCNNTINLTHFTKQFVGRIQAQGPVGDDEIDKIFDQ